MAFIASKTIGFLVLPGNILFLALIAGVVLLRLGRRKWGMRLVTGATAILMFLGLFPVGDWILEPLETRFAAVQTLPEHIDGIIVVGGSVNMRASLRWGRPLLNQHGERLTAAVALAKHYPEARILYTGGIGRLSQDGPAEAEIAARFLHDQGLEPERLMIESKSRNTYENAVFAKKLAAPLAAERWLLITSAFHMPRTVGAFRKAGWRVIPYPVDHKTSDRYWAKWHLNFARYISEANFAFREWVGLVYYYMMGWTSELFPAPLTAGE